MEKELKERIEKANEYYYKTLSEKGEMPEEAVKIFNIINGNIK